MITSVTNLTSENPTLEIWRYLRLFVNVDRGVKQIRAAQKLSDELAEKHKSNLKKQAVQIGYSIRQAEQYFRASNEVGLATRPLLLYYGCVSLSRALILMRKDGNHSFDVLRKQKKHRHHGLVLDEGRAELAGKAKDVTGFFDNLRCTCFVKDSGAPWGHFPLFYESLGPAAFVLSLRANDSDRFTEISRDIPGVCADVLKLDELVSKKLNSLTLLRAFQIYTRLCVNPAYQRTLPGAAQ